MNFLKGVTAKGLLVPYEDYKPLFDYKKIDSYIAPENIPEIIKTADELLEEEIPCSRQASIANSNRTAIVLTTKIRIFCAKK